MKKIVISACILFGHLSTYCQNMKKEISRVDGGIGYGLDYGGVGLKINYAIQEKYYIFSGVGYNFVGLGLNVGAGFRILPKSRVFATIGLMYGSNRVIKIKNTSQYDKIYYGPSAVFGLNFRSKKHWSNYFSTEVLISYYSQSFTNDYNALRNNPAISLSAALPFSLSLGYQIGF